MIRTAPLALCAALPLCAHVMSMSTGDVIVEGSRATYELRMPMYEVAHVTSPERSIFEHVRFFSQGHDAKLIRKSCKEEASQGNYVCQAGYEFPAPVDRLGVECTFHSITVPNHVHLLRAQKGDKRDQAIFDFSFTKTEIRFDPPSPTEIAVTQTGAGFMRAVGGLVQILFLSTLVLAGRGRRELAALTAMFLAGQILSAILTPMTRWEPAPRFVEAATALTIAYMAVEILALPKAGQRWLIAGVLGVFHGLYFSLFLRTTGYHPVYVLSGAVVAEIGVVGMFSLISARIGRMGASTRPVQVFAGLLLGVGMFWFFVRLRS